MSIYDAAKDVANILKEAGKIEEYRKILDLIGDLFEKRNKIEELEKENRILKEKSVIKESYEFKNNSYWKKDNGDGPFCSRCFDKETELIRIIPLRPGSNRAKCHVCNSIVNYTGKPESNTHVFRPLI